MARGIWGVDSAAKVTEKSFTCVKSRLGYPKYWGRYLTDVPSVSDGLTKSEITFLRNHGVKIVPIYNKFKKAVGYAQGRTAAVNTLFHARRLGIPKNKVLFANIEDYFEVDEAWIRGWVEAIYPSGYRPGIYHDPIKGMFSAAYCEAVQNNSLVAKQPGLWSSTPRPGTTKEQSAPAFKPAAPKCESNVGLWQYGRDSSVCPVDTNLALRKLLDYLY
jgi:hypothetical protein